MSTESTPVPETKEKTSFQIVRRGQLAAGHVFDWDDPEKLAPLNPQKYQTWLTNPLADNDEDPVQIIGLLGRRVIGKIDLLAGRCQIDGRETPILWTSELYVPEQFRKTMMGVSLILKMQTLGKYFGACGISIMATPLFAKLKWLNIPMRRHIALRRSRSVVTQKLGAGFLGIMASFFVDIGLRLYWLMLAMKISLSTMALDCKPLDLNDASTAAKLDAAFQQSAGKRKFHRSSKWVQWVLNNDLSDNPRNKRVAFGIYGNNGELDGYFLIRDRFYPVATHRQFKNLTLGSLSDWAIFDSTTVTLKQVVLLALRELARRKVDAMEICIAEHEAKPNLKWWGLVPVGELQLMLKTPTSANETAADWTVRPADGDNGFG